MSIHEPIVYGPVNEGAPTISGDTYPMSGYGWSCTCGASGFGYASEDEASDYAEAHDDRHPGGCINDAYEQFIWVDERSGLHKISPPLCEECSANAQPSETTQVLVLFDVQTECRGPFDV